MTTLKRLTLLTLILTFLVISLGAYTRLKDAGLGCPDWPGCYGQWLVPMSEIDIRSAEQAYPDNKVDPGRAWPEMIHRYAASLLGLLIIMLNLLCWRLPRRIDHNSIACKQLQKTALLLLILVIFQGALGRWTVTLKLHPLIVTAHLLGGFCTLYLLTQFFWQLMMPTSLQCHRHGASKIEQSTNIIRHPMLLPIALATIVCQIFLGGWTSANYAATTCMQLPFCAADSFEWDLKSAFYWWQLKAESYQYGILSWDARVSIHQLHRFGAVACCLVIGLLSWQLFHSHYVRLKQMSMVLVSLLITQMLLGLSNILFVFPITIAVAHNLGAASLLLCTALVNFECARIRQQLRLQQIRPAHSSLISPLSGGARS